MKMTWAVFWVDSNGIGNNPNILSSPPPLFACPQAVLTLSQCAGRNLGWWWGEHQSS